MKAFIFSPMLASLQDAARSFSFSGGAALFVRFPTGYGSCKPSACGERESSAVAVEPRSVGPDNLLSGRAQRAGSDALNVNLRFLWLRFAPPPGQQVVRANQPTATTWLFVELMS
jgi:hypothetical protein